MLPVYGADVMGIPVFEILKEMGGTLPDYFILMVVIGIFLFAFFWVKYYIKRDAARWEERENKWNQTFTGVQKDWKDSQDKLREDWEDTFETMRVGLKETFAQLSKTHEAQITSLQSLIVKLEEQKTWTESCILKHTAIDEWKKTTEDRLKEGNAKFAEINKQLFELSKK